MATLDADEFARFDAAIDGTGLLLDWQGQERGYRFAARDLQLEREEEGASSRELTENKLDDQKWGSNRSWHEGAGQKRLDMPEASSPFRYWRSRGVDISEPGQLTLAHEHSRVLQLDNLDPAAQVMTVTDHAVFVASGQPNVKRFTQLDASDAEDATTGTETSQEVRDLASDGELVYAALGPDGIHRSGAPTETQEIDCDTTTGWTGGTISAITSDKKEGVASLRMESAGSWTFTFGSAQDFSSVDLFRWWVKARSAVTNYEVRFVTSSGNYFTIGASSLRHFHWVEVEHATASMTSVGSPNWSSIASIEFHGTASTGTNALHVDDIRSVAPGAAMSHWSDWDARAIGFVKDAIYAAGIKSGTQWRFFAADSAATSTPIFVLPDGWEVVDIVELAGFIYFSARRQGRGVIYAYDGDNAPFVALALPNGEVPTGMIPFLGAGMLLGSKKASSGSSRSGGAGVLYRAFPIGSGHLTAEKVADLGSDDGADYGPRVGVAFGDRVYWGWNHADNTASAETSGLGLYLPQHGSHSYHFTVNSGGVIAGCVVFKGRVIFTVDGDGVYVEQDTYVSSGFLESSDIDLNIHAPKMWLTQEIGYELEDDTDIIYKYSTDGGETFTGAVTADSGDRSRTSINVASRSIRYRVELNSLSGKENTPTLLDSGIGGYPSNPSGPFHLLVIRAFPEVTYRNGAQETVPDYAWTLLDRLRTLRDSATGVDFQDPMWPLNQTTRTVRIVRLEGDITADGDKPSGLINLIVKEVT